MAANLERLKKRIRTLEDWVDENESIGGPEGTLDTFNYLINQTKQMEQMQGHLNQLQQYLQMFLQENELMDKWNEFVQEKENAVQKQSTAPLDVREQTEDGEEVGEGDSEGDDTPKEKEADN